jgi:serine/threonine-protein kinase RsbW
MAEQIVMKIELPKIPDIELVALSGVERMAQHLGISEAKIGEAKIIITEAIINAFEHSGGSRPRIRVEYTMNREKLVIYVRDYGKGFDPEKVAMPDIKEKIFSQNKRGWGLKLMRTMSDDLIIESDRHGTKLTITKHLV